MIDAINHTRANAFYRCGEQFRRIYLENERIAPGIALHRERSFLAGANLENKTKALTGDDAPLDEIADAVRDSFMRNTKDEGIFLLPEEVSFKRTLLNDGLQNSIELATVYRDVVARKYNDISIGGELLTADVGLELPLSGEDELAIDGKIVILKTTSAKWPYDKETTEIQPTISRILRRENNKSEFPAEYVILSNTKTGVNIDTRFTPRTNADEFVLKRRLQVMIDMMNAGIFPPAEPGSWICSPRWCGFYYQCKYSK